VGVGKQGVLDRIDRLEALLNYDRPDEKISRASRRSERERQDRMPVEVTWLRSRRDELQEIITGLVEQATVMTSRTGNGSTNSKSMDTTTISIRRRW